jgi:acyl phosphate:glycerol-3-phosphate acyltransferase
VIPVFLILFAYVLGAVPTGYLLARRLKGIDIRRVGSGNPGATNVFRTVGKAAGAATLLIDAGKGWLPVWLAQRAGPGDVLPVLCGLAAVAGHTWPVFLSFRGGKGVATSAGVFLALLPLPTLAALAAFGLGFGFSRHVSIGSLAGAAALAPAAFLLHGPGPAAALALALGVLVAVKHIPNIRRILRGEELGVGRPAEREEK